MLKCNKQEKTQSNQQGNKRNGRRKRAREQWEEARRQAREHTRKPKRQRNKRTIMEIKQHEKQTRKQNKQEWMGEHFRFLPNCITGTSIFVFFEIALLVPQFALSPKLRYWYLKCRFRQNWVTGTENVWKISAKIVMSVKLFFCFWCASCAPPEARHTWHLDEHISSEPTDQRNDTHRHTHRHTHREGVMVCRWSWRIESIEPTRNLFLKTVARVCSWRLKKQGNPSLRTGINSPMDSHFVVQGGNSHLFLETKNTRRSTFENKQKQHNLLAIFVSRQ